MDKPVYTPTLWINEETKLNATNFNHLEQGVLNNNTLSIYNANYIEEIHTAIIELLNLTFNAQTKQLKLIIGNSEPTDPSYTSRFNTEVSAIISGFVTNEDAEELLAQKVDKEEGKVLSDNNFSDSAADKLNGIASNAQVNVLEGVVLNGQALPIDQNKRVSIETNQFLVKKGVTDNAQNTVYAVGSYGEQTNVSMDTGGASFGMIPLRDNNGHIIIPLTPTANNHAASRAYVDSKASSLEVVYDDDDYTITFRLRDSNNNILSNHSIDLPLESVVVSGSYDDEHEQIVLTLENGNTIPIPVSDLVSGLVNSTTLSNTLAGYVAKTEVVDDLNSTATDVPLSANQGKVLKEQVDSKVSTTTFNSALASKEDTLTIGNGLKRDTTNNEISSLILASDVVININD